MTQCAASEMRDASPTTGVDASACPLCGDESRELLSQLDRKGKALETAICTRCGLVSHLKIPSDAELEAYYATTYRLEYHNEETPSARRVMRAWRQGRRLLRMLRPFIQDGSSVFEIGAGLGCNVKAFELAGYDASGVEPGRGFQRYAKERLCANVQCATLEQTPTTPKADIVLLAHVIEHLRDPQWALGKIRELMADDGYLYVECPNLAAPFATPGRLFHRAHIFNFTASTLQAFAKKAGLETAHRFGDDDDANLSFLFRACEQGDSFDAENYERTLAAIRRYNAMTYHLRARYLAARGRKVLWYLLEYAAAPLLVKRLVRRCRAAGAP